MTKKAQTETQTSPAQQWHQNIWEKISPWWHHRYSPWVFVLISGLLAGWASSVSVVPLAWPFVYVPLFLALYRWKNQGIKRPMRRGILAGWLTGVVQAGLIGGWIVNTSHVYGGLPVGIAHGVNLLGYGSLLGLEVALFLCIPFLMGLSRPRWGFFLVPLWAVVGQAFAPRFFYWSFGQFLHPADALVQVTDVIGSVGLNLLVLPLYLVLFGWMAYGESKPGTFVVKKDLLRASAGVAVLFMIASVYGVVGLIAEEEQVEKGLKKGKSLTVVGIQPNVSLRRLASNPDMSYSSRTLTIDSLLEDSEKAIAALPQDRKGPLLLVWPESVYPFAYFRAAPIRDRVEAWLKEKGAELILVSVTTKPPLDPEERWMRIFSSAIHVSPDGSRPTVYDKIALIPFGETIPFAETFPWFRKMLKAAIPQISEFHQGKEHTVFTLKGGIVVAPLICFDAVTDDVLLGMAKNKAELGVVMANLAWFGKTNISDLFSLFVRFRALETRMPMILLSQNGESVIYNALGREITPRLPLFTEGVLTKEMTISPRYSFYAEYHAWINGMFFFLLAGVLLWGYRTKGQSK